MKKQPNRKFTEEEKRQIIELYKQGIGPIEICRRISSCNTRKPQTLYPILIKAGLYTKKPADDLRKFKINDHYFDTIDTEHKAYWIGFLLADGFLSNAGHAKHSFGVTIKSDDGYILEQLQQDLDTTYKIHKYIQNTTFNRTTHVVKFMATSKHIYAALSNLGFTTNKSYDAILPLNKIPEYLWNHLIRGYFDGDGSLSLAGEKKRHTYVLSFTGTYEVISSIRHVLSKDNVKLARRHPERNNNNYFLALCGDRQVYNICKWMYQDATIYLRRKYERFKILEQKYISKKQSSPQECGR